MQERRWLGISPYIPVIKIELEMEDVLHGLPFAVLASNVARNQNHLTSIVSLNVFEMITVE